MTWSTSQRRSVWRGWLASAARHLVITALLVSQLAVPFFHNHTVGYVHLGWHGNATIAATALDAEEHADYGGHPLDTLHVVITVAAIHHMDAALAQPRQQAWRTSWARVPSRWTIESSRLQEESLDTPQVPLRAIFRTLPPANRGPPQIA